MGIPPFKASVKIDADHSCNWKCCFGCKEKEVESPKSQIIEETIHKVTIVHRHTPHNTPRESMDGMSPPNLGAHHVEKWERQPSLLD